MLPLASIVGHENMAPPVGERPLLAAVRIDGVKLVVVRADVDGAVGFLSARCSTRRGAAQVNGGKGALGICVGKPNRFLLSPDERQLSP